MPLVSAIALCPAYKYVFGRKHTLVHLEAGFEKSSKINFKFLWTNLWLTWLCVWKHPSSLHMEQWWVLKYKIK